MIRLVQNTRATLGRLRRQDEGAALVEFAIVLPLMLLFFAVIIEGSNLFWSYQTTIAGVRDATRYLARIVEHDICTTGGSLDQYSGLLKSILNETLDQSASVTVTSASATLECYTGNFRLSDTAVAKVTAVIEINHPFKGVFEFIGGSLPDKITTVTDSSRIYGV